MVEAFAALAAKATAIPSRCRRGQKGGERERGMTRHIASLVLGSTLTPTLSRKQERGQYTLRDQRASATNQAQQHKQKDGCKTRAPASREVARCSTSNAKCRDAPLMKTLTHDSCPNGAPTAQSEFYRVPPNSSALLVTFRAPAKSYSPAGARPGTRPQTRRRGEGDKSIKRPSYPKRHTGLALGLP